MASGNWYLQDPLEQRQSEIWGRHTSAFPSAYNSPESGEQKSQANFQVLNPYCATGVTQNESVHSLPAAGTAPDQATYFPTRFHPDVQYGSRLKQYNINRYAVQFESTPEKLHEPYESAPIPFVPGIKEEENFYDAFSCSLDCAETCTSSNQVHDTDSSWSDQSDRDSERAPVSGALDPSSHFVANRAPRMLNHTHFGSSQEIVARGGSVVDDFTQPNAVYTLECACGLKMNGAHARGNLARHRRSKGCTASSETRRVQCPECPQVFWRSDALLNHRRKKHDAPPCRPSRLRRHKEQSLDC